MASITLTDNCLEDTLRLRELEVVRGESYEISPFTASHYFASPKVDITFTEDDRVALEALPQREMSFLANTLNCELDEVVNTLLPKKTPSRRGRKKKATTVKEEQIEIIEETVEE